MIAFLKSKKIISFQKNFLSKRYQSSNEVKKIIKNLNRKKSAITSWIPVSILIDTMDIYLPLLTDIINDSLKRGIFLDELKLAEVKPWFEKAGPFEKAKYQPVSLLSHISKVFERLIYNQFHEYIEPFLSKLLTGFRKNHNTQHSLLRILENFQEALDKKVTQSALSSRTYPKRLIS